ncbi:MAG TPA: hypothetical protein VFG24_07545 [Nitrosopumilaceae archaeon]|nr:hypothetical protein [Nitrosopumilaceae archaeon]
MPDESCRTCGGILVNCSLCPSCRKMTQRICNICGFKTEEQIHPSCLYVESSQTRNGMKINVIAPMSSKRKEIHRKSEKMHPLQNALLVFGIIGFFVLGFATANYFDLFQSQASETQTMKTAIPQPLPQSHDALPRGSFDNCLAYGSGQSMTVACPTEYGYVYKAILDIPAKLASEFSGEVFSIRGLSVVEYSDGSVVLQYHKNLYATNFAN